MLLSLGAIHWNEPLIFADEGEPVAESALPDRLPSFQSVVTASAAQLALLSDSDAALPLFKTIIGPRLGLDDAAMAVGAKGLSPAMAKNFLVADLTRSAKELMRGLAAWQLAEAARRVGADFTTEQVEGLHRQIQTQRAWFSEHAVLERSLRQMLTLLQSLREPETLSESETTSLHQTTVTAGLAEATAQVEMWASHIVHREWFRLFNWKDQVRQQRGLAKLCGTWQWSIHNHQNHREEKTAVIFPPPGAVSTAGLAEISVLGDSVYLRWETRAAVQEDSLLFSAEGQRLEGTFVNSAGGWGSITGKRTASCATKMAEPPAAGQRRRH